MASQELQEPQQHPQARSNAPAEYLAFIRPTALSADRVDRVASEVQPSLRIAALNATIAKHRSTIAALEATNKSLTARLAHEEWTAPEQILNEDLRLEREENIKLRGREKNFITSLKRADLRIKNDGAKIAALQKELSDLKHYDASLTKDIRDLLARHP